MSVFSHEELFHNTENTQTDESYVHPEDIAHFAAHVKIEAEEEALILKAQGLSSDVNSPDVHPATPLRPLQRYNFTTGWPRRCLRPPRR